MKRALGLTMLGSLFVFSGGAALLVIIIEILDSIARYGWASLTIASLASLEGFLRHLMLPILLYNTGIGLLLLQSWARRIAVYVLPITFVVLLTTENTVILWAVVAFGIVYYLTRPEIKRQFGQITVSG